MAEKKETDKPEEVKKAEPATEVELTQVVTGTAPAYKMPDGEIYQAEELFAWMANCIWQIKKQVS